jgi:flagellar protein FliS
MSYNLNALKQYQSVDVNSAINTASQHKLISMLFEGALTALARAKGLIDRNDTEGKSEQINKATDIIIGLKSCLNLEEGGEVANNLDGLYNYMLSRLMRANMDNDEQAIDEVVSLITEVKSGWNEIPEEHRA